MSYNIVHVLSHGSVIKVEKGIFICELKDGDEKKIPVEDILAVVLAARGISLSAGSISALLKGKAVILHCDEKYSPAGITAPVFRVVHADILKGQIQANRGFSESLWNNLLKSKIQNQIFLLDDAGAEHKLQFFWKQHQKEGNLARHYWKVFFAFFGDDSPGARRYRNAQDKINGALNYGYSVLKAICHRSTIVHGLNPCLGVYHKYRFKAEPLVYDLIEPLRPFCDMLLLRFYAENPNFEMKEWAKFFVTSLSNAVFKANGGKMTRFFNEIDLYCSSVAICFSSQSIDKLKTPLLSNIEIIENG